MKISVVIPTYNSSKTIKMTLSSVLLQTVQPDEIIVIDDGSTDDTVLILENYKPTITIFQQTNRGVASARNVLCQKAKGDLIAFLDHDDIWHPKYLEIQKMQYHQYSNAVAFFTGHINFYRYAEYHWTGNKVFKDPSAVLMEPLSFLKKYHKETGLFGSASFLCIPRQVLSRIGDRPFCEKVSGADDFYLCNLFPLLGPVVYTPVPLVAYRITESRQSKDKLKALRLSVEALEIIEGLYRNSKDKKLQ